MPVPLTLLGGCAKALIPGEAQKIQAATGVPVSDATVFVVEQGVDPARTEAAWHSLEGAERWSAYRQAWFLVSVIVNHWGEDRGLDLMKGLPVSTSLDGDLKAKLGLDSDGLESINNVSERWRAWNEHDARSIREMQVRPR